ncbi:MAG: Trm112 family protein [Holophagaceae bacterium]|nr:Trm112 family protein [Holophagaceae bacterium]
MLDPRLLEILCCPADHEGAPCHGDIQESAEGLLCLKCGLIYPIEDGIPVMLSEHAKKADA